MHQPNTPMNANTLGAERPVPHDPVAVLAQRADHVMPADEGYFADSVHAEHGIANENGHALRDAGDRLAGAVRIRI